MEGIVLVVEGSSVLAREVTTLNPEFPARYIGHDKVDDPSVYEGIGAIVNFSFAAEMYSQNYDCFLDIDLRIAEHAEATEIGYVVLWMIEGFGKGQLVVENLQVIDEFQLDSPRLRQATELQYGRSEVANHCHDMGRRLTMGGVAGGR